MNDLISRQAAIDALTDYICIVDKVYSTGKLSADDCRDVAKSVLDDLPSVQPERGKGHWKTQIYEIPISQGYSRELINCVCSECGSEYSEASNYCPNCGAKMEGER